LVRAALVVVRSLSIRKHDRITTALFVTKDRSSLGAGIVDSLAPPRGNVTGFTTLEYRILRREVTRPPDVSAETARSLAECFLDLRDERSEKLCVALPLEHPEAGVDASFEWASYGSGQCCSETGLAYRRSISLAESH
jgi:hypothetical protein